MKYDVEVFPARDIPEEPVVAKGVSKVSFIDNDSHGPGGNFGLTAGLVAGTRVAFIATPNVSLVTVEVVND